MNQRECKHILIVFGLSTAIGIVAVFLSKINDDAAAALLGLFAIGMGYTCWRPAHKSEDGRSVFAFARDVYKVLPLLLALFGVIVLAVGLGNLTGFELLTALGEAMENLLRAGSEP